MFLQSKSYKKKSSTPLNIPAIKKNMPDSQVFQTSSIPSMPVLLLPNSQVSASLPVSTVDKENVNNVINTPAVPLPESPVLPKELEELFNSPNSISAPDCFNFRQKESNLQTGNLLIQDYFLKKHHPHFLIACLKWPNYKIKRPKLFLIRMYLSHSKVGP